LTHPNIAIARSALPSPVVEKGDFKFL
jgi:hypothetical protein